ncbi:ankyrin [endosymbiont of Acanthamoeba sp. UWC8]|uniref:ankyrin repeat domain-containing protein n=1 Tax=endosymbiont of Acanthamoeba sp. UWC8 TaxID=86106 RepID=UPI0004D14DC9|nr:ankyrin repeat domain-containing protein [endosymbiont of Acanthamoeba sp. UWC8]AIF80619.1 ankyrin [endosymbiont of Acanthamoeba sp. UWC8]
MKNDTQNNDLNKLSKELNVILETGTASDIENFVKNHFNHFRGIKIPYFRKDLDLLPDNIIIKLLHIEDILCYVVHTHGNYRILKLCLEANKSVNYIDINYEYGANEGYPLLHNEVIYGSFDCVKLLLEEGANPYLKNYKGRIPINYSKDEGITELLLSWMQKEQTSNKRDREDFEGFDKKEESTPSKRAKNEECCEELDSKQRDEQIEKRRLADSAKKHSQDITKFFKSQDKPPVGKHSERISKESECKGKEKAL